MYTNCHLSERGALPRGVNLPALPACSAHRGTQMVPKKKKKRNSQAEMWRLPAGRWVAVHPTGKDRRRAPVEEHTQRLATPVLDQRGTMDSSFPSSASPALTQGCHFPPAYSPASRPLNLSTDTTRSLSFWRSERLAWLPWSELSSAQGKGTDKLTDS